MANWKKIDADQLDAELTTIADAIRSKTGGTDPLPFDQMAQEIDGISVGGDTDAAYEEGLADGIEQGFEAGTQWLKDMLLTRTSLMYAFSYINVTTAPPVPIYAPVCTDFSSCFHLSSIPEITIIGGNLDIKANYCFYGLGATKITIRDVGQITNAQAMFTQRSNNSTTLVEIDADLDFAEGAVVTGAFNYCTKLEKVRFKQGGIKNTITFAMCYALNDDSLQSIVDGLADLTGKTTQSVTLANAVGRRLNDTQKATISAKNWTLVY